MNKFKNAPCTCLHKKHIPKFNKKAAKNLSVADIRKRWPRYFGKCSECNEGVILYASWAHFVYGDWYEY